MTMLGTWLVALAGPVVKKAMVALGIGVVSYAAIATALAAAISAAKASWSGFPADALGLFELSGAGTAIGIICGAMTARVALQVVKRFEILR